MSMPSLCLILFTGLFLTGSASGQAPAPVVRIGGIASSAAAGPRTLQLTRYLAEKIPDYSFKFVSLAGPDELLAAVKNQGVDFVEVSPSLLVELEVRYGVTPVATAINSARPGFVSQRYGGAVFCRAGDSSIRRLQDLRRKRVAAVHERSLGGALSVWRELRSLGIQPERDLKEIRYAGTVERVIEMVLQGQADCGCAGSDSLEEILYQGYTDRSLIRVLPPPRAYPGMDHYPLPVSTRLYPNAAFVKVHEVPLALAKKVATALLSLDVDDETARTTGLDGWSVPLNYQSVHECLQELGIAPYEDYGKVTAADFIRQNWAVFFAGLLVVIVALGASTGRASILNRRLRASQAALEEELEQRITAEQAREKLEEQLRRSQRLESIGRLAGGVAHDFNNLLTVINGYSELLLKRLPAGESFRQGLEQIHSAGARAASLTQQLLAFSRKQITCPRPLDLNSTVTEAGKMLRRVVGEDIEVIVRLDPSLGLVMADPGQMHQVLMNLAVNARDAMPSGGRLIFETANVTVDEDFAADHPELAIGDYVRMTVSDTGVGMGEEVQRHLFEPFFTTKEQGKGTGLGLSTVYGIVRQSNGWIWVYSEPDKGTTFKIYLPRVTSTEPAGEAAGSSSPSRIRGSETILVVEDQEEVRRFARTALEAYGYRVVEAGSAAAALEVVARGDEPIDLTLTDVVMPGMKGTELAARLAQIRPGMKVLFMSGYTENVIVHTGVLKPGIAFLAKPFAPEELAAKVREILGPPAPGR